MTYQDWSAPSPPYWYKVGVVVMGQNYDIDGTSWETVGLSGAAGTGGVPNPVHNYARGQHYSTIQAAVDDAWANGWDGDRIDVDAGTYYENVVINVALELHGESAREHPHRTSHTDAHLVPLSAEGNRESAQMSPLHTQDIAVVCYEQFCELSIPVRQKR